MASLLNTCMLAGIDPEGTKVMDEGGKPFHVNTAAYGYENAINSFVATMNTFSEVPSNAVLVFEGAASKSRRCAISKDYKANREKRPPEYYEQFGACYDQVKAALEAVGAISVVSDYVEGDDTIAYLCQNSREDCVVVSNDGDLNVLQGVSIYGAEITTYIGAAVNSVKSYPPSLTTLYKSLVGDSTDNIKGVNNFGPKSFEYLLASYGEDGCTEVLDMLKAGNLSKLEKFADDNNCKVLRKVYEGREEALLSFRLASLYPQWVDTNSNPLRVSASVISKATDERLAKWGQQTRLITATNFNEALKFYKANVKDAVALDLETSSVDESDDWISAQGGEGGGVDVLAAHSHRM